MIGNMKKCILLLFLTITLVKSHSLSLSSCPSLESMENFDLERFLGKWYIVEVYSAMNDCMSVEYRQSADGSLQVVQRRELAATNSLSIPHTFKYTASAAPAEQSPADMIISWPASGWMGSMSHQILFTDYEEMAVTFECQQVLFMSRQSGMILSRSPNPSEELVKQMKEIIASKGVSNTENFKRVDQSSCADPQNALDLDFGGNFLGLYTGNMTEAERMHENDINTQNIDPALFEE